MVDNSVGLRIKGIVDLLWKIGVAAVIAFVVISTIVYANTGSYYYRPGGGQVFLFFLISAAGGGVSVFFLYVLKILIEGFGELVYRAESIDERLMDMSIVRKKENGKKEEVEKEVPAPEAGSEKEAPEEGAQTAD